MSLVVFFSGMLFGGVLVWLWSDAGARRGTTTEPVQPFAEPRYLDTARLAHSLKRGPRR